LKIFLVFFVVV